MLLLLLLLLLLNIYYRFNNHPVLNDRYLLLSMLGKGGFSEVHKVSNILIEIHPTNKMLNSKLLT